MAYLHRSGELTKFYPEDLIKNDCDLSVKVRYEVHLLNDDNEIVAIERFPAYPNEQSIRWCFLRYKGKASKANVKKVYVPVWDY
jgi:hypothetical protein